MASHFHNKNQLVICNNENKELKTITYDLFTEFGIYLNKNVGFEVFNNYFKNSPKLILHKAIARSPHSRDERWEILKK